MQRDAYAGSARSAESASADTRAAEAATAGGADAAPVAGAGTAAAGRPDAAAVGGTEARPAVNADTAGADVTDVSESRSALTRKYAERYGVSVSEIKRQVRDLSRVLRAEGSRAGGKQMRRTAARVAENVAERLEQLTRLVASLPGRTGTKKKRKRHDEKKTSA